MRWAVNRLTTSESAALIIIVALLLLAGWQASQLTRYRQQPYLYPGDELYVKRAAALWARKVGEDATSVMKDRYAIAVHLGGMTCVQLSLKVGSAGGNPSYCFNDETGLLMNRYDNVE